MGLSKPALRFLVREHRRKPLRGSMLTLGRQCVYATFDEFLRICRDEGVSPVELPADAARRTNVPAWLGTPLERNTSDQAVFRSLGLAEVLALDYSDFEGAELVGDLNRPVPEQLASRFDVILDSGTLEHVFDVRAALTNVGQMLRTGGRVIHITPCNNFANHGFYQFSPTLLADYYAANAFADLQVFVAEETGPHYESSAWELFQFESQRQPVLMTSRRRLLLLVVAEKTPQSTVDRVPLQSYYRQMFDPWNGEELGDAVRDTSAWKETLKRILPVRVKTFLRRWLLRDPQRKPWGAKRRGMLK
jgi:SAM-dependent methyltransferase